MNGAGFGPGWHLASEPIERFLLAILLGIQSDLLGDLRGRRFHLKVDRAIGSPQRSEDAHPNENELAAHRHAWCLLQPKWEKIQERGRDLPSDVSGKVYRKS